MKLTGIANMRLLNQQLARTDFRTGSEMVRWFGAVQGQEYAQTKWGLGLRLPGTKDEDIEKELAAGAILRTHLLRPTWHFASSRDIRWLLLLTAPAVQKSNGFMYRKLELDKDVFQRSNKVLIKLLEGDNQLTRNEINKVFKKNKIIAEGHRLSYIMMNAELEGIICSGARRDKQFTYTLLDERAPERNKLNREEALAELTMRYFRSRGPATIYDFSTWSGLTLKECREGVNILKDLLTEETVESSQYYFIPNNSSVGRKMKSLLLLPVYDELVMGYKNREAFMQHKKTLLSQSTLTYDSTIFYGGQIIGTWKRTINNKSIDLFCNFFEYPDETIRNKFQKCVHRFEKFYGLKVEVR